RRPRPRRHRARRDPALPSAPRRGRRTRAGRPRQRGRAPHPGPPRIRASRLHRERAESVPPRGHGVLRPRRQPHASRLDRRLSTESGRPCRAGSHGQRSGRPLVRRSDRPARMGLLGPGVSYGRSTQRDRAGMARDRAPRGLRALLLGLARAREAPESRRVGIAVTAGALGALGLLAWLAVAVSVLPGPVAARLHDPARRITGAALGLWGRAAALLV